MISGPTTIEPGEGADPISIDLSAFLNNGIPDLKDIIPYHTWDDIENYQQVFSGIGIIEDLIDIDGVEFQVYYPEMLDLFISISGGSVDDPSLPFLGSFSKEGIFTVQGRITGIDDNPTLETLDAGTNILEDGSVYLDDEGRFSMTEEAYETFSTYVAEHPEYYFNNVISQPKMNFSSSHPFGLRGSDGAFRFAGRLKYAIPDDTPLLILTSAANSGVEVEMPVFPDPTFGGLFPGMTADDLAELLGFGGE